MAENDSSCSNLIDVDSSVDPIDKLINDFQDINLPELQTVETKSDHQPAEAEDLLPIDSNLSTISTGDQLVMASHQDDFLIPVESLEPTLLLDSPNPLGTISAEPASPETLEDTVPASNERLQISRVDDLLNDPVGLSEAPLLDLSNVEPTLVENSDNIVQNNATDVESDHLVVLEGDELAGSSELVDELAPNCENTSNQQACSLIDDEAVQPISSQPSTVENDSAIPVELLNATSLVDSTDSEAPTVLIPMESDVSATAAQEVVEDSTDLMQISDPVPVEDNLPDNAIDQSEIQPQTLEENGTDETNFSPTNNVEVPAAIPVEETAAAEEMKDELKGAEDIAAAEAAAAAVVNVEVETSAKQTPSKESKTPQASESLHHIKTIQFKDRKVGIVTQNENGPCPLVAIVNVLLLRREISLAGQSPEIVSASKLMEYIGNRMLETTPKNPNLNDEYNLEDAVSVLPKLQTGLDVNVKFTGVRKFECTPESTVFDVLHIPLYHGWLVDPQSPEVEAIGNEFPSRQTQLVY